MQNFKPKFSQAFEKAPELKTERKSGIKEIICPETYSPIWQKAFALADNVRFTRTPDSELQRRRAVLDPVYAKILAEAEQAKAEHEKARAAAEAEIKAAEAEAGFQAEAHNRHEQTAQLHEEAEAVFAAAPAPETAAPVSETAASEMPAVPLAPAANSAAAEILRTNTAFPWEAADNSNSRGLPFAAAEYFTVQKAAAAPVQAAPAKTESEQAKPEQRNPVNISRLFKSMECRRPQLRWIPVAAEAAEQAESTAAPQSSLNAASGADKAPSDFNAFYTREAFISASGGWAPPALNLQVRVENYGVPQPSAAVGKAAETKNAAAAENLDALCSLAVEKNGAAAEVQDKRQTPPAPEIAAAEIAAQAEPAAQTETKEKLRAGQAEAETRAAIALAAEQKREAEAQANRKPHPLPQAQALPKAKYSYQLPDLELLQEPQHDGGNVISQESLERSAGLLESVLEDFGVKGEIIHVRPGPVVTLYEFEPAPGVKSSRIINLSDDIARSMSSVAARVAVIPGRNVIGIELPNKKREMVYLREILQSKAYKTSEYKLPLALGKNIGGEPIIAELAKMPHLLVAGTTGSGKSVAINTMILSLLYRMPPSRCRLIMVDPKMLELSVYEGIPHLLTPVVTDPKKAITALKWAVREMEERYRKMAKLSVRNIDGFNARVKEALAKGEIIMCNVQAGFDKETGELLYTEEAMDLTPLPYIVIIVDEMADLMMVAGKEIEGAIQRLAQMARAAGIHLIMATQRPSVDVITGTIKANFPTRISFQVTGKIDSRTILGEQGAETLLGQGDMLQMAGGGRLNRVHGPFVSDREVEKIVAHLKTQGTPEYLATVTESSEEEEQSGKAAEGEDGRASVAEIVAAAASGNEDFDDLYVQAVKIVMRDRKCSTSYIQRRLGIGYNKAATLVEKMEEEGLVGEANHVGKREILA